MAIPDYETVMLPLLQTLADGVERRIGDLREQLAQHFGLTELEREQRLPSGQATVIASRVGWAKTYLKNAGLVEQPGRGRIRITEEGRRFLAHNPNQLGAKDLERYPSFLAFKNRTRDQAGEEASQPLTERQTPLERIEESVQALEVATADELLDRLKTSSPAFFEQIVVKLLLAMGYGGTTGQGFATGKSGDGGIDGVIQEDKLGLDVVSIQAKRWEASVGRPIVQAFVGSMDYIRAKKGVIITTSAFSRDAVDFVEKIEGKKVVLVDGQRLTQLMLDHDVGVTITKVYKLKEVSSDFFSEDDG